MGDCERMKGRRLAGCSCGQAATRRRPGGGPPADPCARLCAAAPLILRCCGYCRAAEALLPPVARFFGGPAMGIARRAPDARRLVIRRWIMWHRNREKARGGASGAAEGGMLTRLAGAGG